MKKCPQCEFIYEDDQTLCDMDGALLVYDSRALPNLHALTTLPEKTLRRNRAVPAFATLTLALVLGLVYYVSTQRTTHTADIPPLPPVVTESAAPPPPPVEVEDAAATEADKTNEPRKEESKPAATKPSSSKKPAVKSDSSSQSKTSTENKKDDSKVGSILKKTGKILKKPFKF
jgi:type IV secretory pathway VirB10-like protein